MNLQNVLILGNHANRELIKVLSGLGFEPQLWGSTQQSLDKLRHREFAAVVIDQKFTHADPLEFILNVRDIDDRVPVVVIGSGTDERIDRKILKQDRTIILGESEMGDNLAEKLTQALKGNENKDV